MTGLVELQRRIATRIRHGGSLAEVERELIACSSLADEQLPALRLYARGLLRARRLENPLLSSREQLVR